MVRADHIEGNVAVKKIEREDRRDGHEARRQARKKHAVDVAAVEKRYDENPYPHLNGKLIGFVVKTKNNQFKALIGSPCLSHDDNDSFVRVLAQKDSVPTLDEALSFFEADLDKIAKVYRKPSRSLDMCTMHWVSELERAEAGLA